MSSQELEGLAPAQDWEGGQRPPHSDLISHRRGSWNQSKSECSPFLFFLQVWVHNLVIYYKLPEGWAIYPKEEVDLNRGQDFTL